MIKFRKMYSVRALVLTDREVNVPLCHQIVLEAQAPQPSVLTSIRCESSGTSTMQSFDDIRAHTDLRISF